MEQEERIRVLEDEVRTLKREIGLTLVEIQKSMPEKAAAPVRWEKKAWILALLNTLLAILLFTSIYIYIPGNAIAELDSTLSLWLRAIWIAIAFIWLLLQLYPLALLLEQEDRQWRGVVWRNGLAVFRDRPALLILLTVAVLVVALIDSIVPAAWGVITLVLLIVVAGVAMQNLLASRRAHE